MAISIEELLTYLKQPHRNDYENLRGVCFHADTDDDFLIIDVSITVIFALEFENAGVELAGSFTLEEFLKTFNILNISELEKIDPSLLWKLFQQGVIYLRCCIDQRTHVFTIGELNGEKAVFGERKLVRSPDYEFTGPQSYLDYCMLKYHRHYKPLPVG